MGVLKQKSESCNSLGVSVPFIPATPLYSKAYVYVNAKACPTYDYDYGQDGQPIFLHRLRHWVSESESETEVGNEWVNTNKFSTGVKPVKKQWFFISWKGPSATGKWIFRYISHSDTAAENDTISKANR